MEWTIDVGGRARAVSVAREEASLAVSVDGRRLVVDARRIAGGLTLLVREDGEAAQSIDVSLAPRAGGVVEVGIDGRTIPAVVVPRFGRRGGSSSGSQGQGPQRLAAPMPGKVVRVLVAPGDEVQARQGLIVVEAMKMENELKAARAGRVRDVLVVEGQSVEAGVLLVTVE